MNQMTGGMTHQHHLLNPLDSGQRGTGAKGGWRRERMVVLTEETGGGARQVPLTGDQVERTRRDKSQALAEAGCRISAVQRRRRG